MGIFKFLGNVGASLFGGGKDEAEEIEKLIQQNLPGKIQNLSVEYKNKTAYLSGTCDSAATKEKAVLLAGNVKDVTAVDDSGLMAPQPVETTEFYTIVKGDTLSKIAKRYYGNAMKYPVIFEANREVIKNPDLIYPGQVIRIPKLS